jgi:hypothetical protein
MSHEHDVITWDAPEYHHNPKSADWYWSLGIIAVSIAILCILLNNVLFAIFILLSAFTAALYAGREPELHTIELRPRGILVQDKMYTFKELDSFWVEEDEHPQKIILKSKKVFMPYIIIHISHISPDDVRIYLKKHLKEVEHHESAAHKLMEYFGF